MKQTRNISALRRHTEGAAIIEFALLLPILILLFAGLIELSQYLRAHEKSSNAANNIAQYMSQLASPTVIQQQSDIWNAYTTLMSPLNVENGGLILSTVQRVNNAPKVTWTRSFGKAGTSTLNSPDAELAQAENGLANDDTMIVVESFYSYQSIFPGMSQLYSGLSVNPGIYRRATFLSRTVTQAPGNPDGSSFTPADKEMTKPSGCCGDYCGGTGGIYDEENKPPEGLDCKGCHSGGRIQCAKNAAAAKKYNAFLPEGKKIPVCDGICPSGGTDCEDRPRGCNKKGG